MVRLHTVLSLPLALVLAVAGIYSVLAYAVEQRSREIGVRMALGADRAAVLRLFIGVGGRLLAVGLIFGSAASIAMVKLVNAEIFNGPGLDPLAFVAAVMLLSVAALVASWLPARRAAKVDPIVALRCE